MERTDGSPRETVFLLLEPAQVWLGAAMFRAAASRRRRLFGAALLLFAASAGDASGGSPLPHDALAPAPPLLGSRAEGEPLAPAAGRSAASEGRAQVDPLPAPLAQGSAHRPCAVEGEICVCAETVFYGRRYAPEEPRAEATFAELLADSWASEPVARLAPHPMQRPLRRK